MRRVLTHAAEKLTAARDTKTICNGGHALPREVACSRDLLTATVYAEAVLRMLASYLRVTNPPEYAPTGPLVFDAETTVRVDDPDSAQKVQADAERILAENGWGVVSEWTVSDNAMYADVQQSNR